MGLRLRARLLLALLSVLVPALAHGQANPSVTATASLTTSTCPGTGCVTLNVAGFGAAAIQLTGTWSGTVTFYTSSDTACVTTTTNDIATPFTRVTSGASASTATSNGLFMAGVGGVRCVRAKFTTATSGTVAAILQASIASAGGSSSGGGGGGGAVTVADGADIAEGATTDVAVGDADGSVNAHLREIAKKVDSGVAITAAALPLPTGASTSALQGVTDADDASIAVGQTVALSGGLSMVYDGSVWRRQTVGVAGTAAAQVTTVQGISSMTPLLTTATGSGNFTVVQPTGTNLHAVLDTTSTTAVTQATGTNLHAVLDANSGVDIGKLTANQSVNLSQVAGGTAINAGVTGSQAIGGCVATNTATPCNPLNLGAQAVTSENSAATTAREVQLVADKVGKLIVMPFANPENGVSGGTAAMTGTTSTSLIASPGGSLRNYLTQITCTNSHATVGTFVLVQDGSGGTTIYEGYAAAVGGGFAIAFPFPLVQPTTATALFVQNVTTGANVICFGSGFKGL